MIYEAGDQLSVWRNQADREAVVLAVVGEKMAVEYEMPKGSSSLLIGPVNFEDSYELKPVSYNACPMYWRKAIKAQSGGWIGKGQSQPSRYKYGGRYDIEPAPLFPDKA